MVRGDLEGEAEIYALIVGRALRHHCTMFHLSSNHDDVELIYPVWAIRRGRSVTLVDTGFSAEVAAALPDKGALVVTYCAGLKCPASHLLGEKLRALGYKNVLEYHEGIEGWVAAGQKVEQAAR